MAKRFPSQNSLVVDRAAIEYDPDTQVMRLILTDEELPAGLVLNVPKGGKIEKTLLSLFNLSPNSGGDSAVQATPQPPAVSAPPVKPVPVTPPVSAAPEPKPATEPVQTVPEEPVSLARTEPLHVDNYIQSFGQVPKINLQKTGNLISLVAPRERAGKSTAAIMLGAALARTPEIANHPNPKKVAVLDLDTTTGELHNFIQTPSAGSYGVYKSGVINKDTLEANLTHSELGIDVLPLNSETWNARDWLGIDFFKRAIEVLKEEYLVVIVDTPSRDFSYFNQELINMSDVVMITNTIDRRQEYSTRQWLQEHFRLRRVVDRTTLLLINTPKEQVEASWEEVKRAHHPISIAGNVPMDSAVFVNAVKNHQIGSLFTSNNIVAEAYAVIADRLVN